MSDTERYIKFRVTVSTTLEINCIPGELDGLNTSRDVERFLTDAITDGAYDDLGCDYDDHRVLTMRPDGRDIAWVWIEDEEWPTLAKRLGLTTGIQSLADRKRDFAATKDGES